MRVDSGVVAGSEITGLYDPMIAKLIVHGVDREHARMRMLRALDEFEIGGLPTLLGFHRALLAHPCFVAGETCHGVVESRGAGRAGRGADGEAKVAARRPVGRRRAPARDRGRGRRPPLRRDACSSPSRRGPSSRGAGASARPRARGGAGGDAVVSPMQGTVLKVEVAEGDAVEAGQVALRRRGDEDGERDRRATATGTVAELSVAAGDAVTSGQVICLVRGE